MKQTKTILIGILMLCIAICLCACGEGNDASTETSSVESIETELVASSEAESETESEPANEAVFKVTVVDGDGNPVPNVMVQVCKDTCIPSKTGEDGVASFNVEITDGYKLSVLSCPSGYEYTGEAEIYLESGITEYTVEVQKGSEA